VLYTLLVIVHVLVALSLIVIILMQSSRGGGLAGAFGGSDIGSIFGTHTTATFLTKLTTILAVIFAVSCVVQGILAPRRVGASRRPVTETVTEREQKRRMPSDALLNLPEKPAKETPPAGTQ